MQLSEIAASSWVRPAPGPPAVTSRGTIAAGRLAWTHVLAAPGPRPLALTAEPVSLPLRGCRPRCSRGWEGPAVAHGEERAPGHRAPVCPEGP